MRYTHDQEIQKSLFQHFFRVRFTKVQMRLHTTSSSRSFLLVMCLSTVSDPVSEEVSSSWSLHTNKMKNNSGINNLYCNKIRQDEKWIFSPRMVYLLAFRPQLFSIQWITKLVFQIPIHWIAALSSFWITRRLSTYTSVKKVACLNEPKISVDIWRIWDCSSSLLPAKTFV